MKLLQGQLTRARGAKASLNVCSSFQSLALLYAGRQYVGRRAQACPRGAAHAAHANHHQILHQVSLRDSSIRNREEEDNGREADQERRRGDGDTRREGGRHSLQSDDSEDSRPGACEDSRHRAGGKNHHEDSGNACGYSCPCSRSCSRMGNGYG